MKKTSLTILSLLCGCSSISSTFNTVNIFKIPKSPVSSYTEPYSVQIGQILPDHIEYDVADDAVIVEGNHIANIVFEGKSYTLKLNDGQKLPILGGVDKKQIPFEFMTSFSGKLAVIDTPIIPGVEKLGILTSGSFSSKHNRHAVPIYLYKKHGEDKWRYNYQESVFKDFKYRFIPDNITKISKQTYYAELLRISDQNDVTFRCNGQILTINYVYKNTNLDACGTQIHVDDINLVAIQYRYIVSQ